MITDDQLRKWLWLTKEATDGESWRAELLNEESDSSYVVTGLGDLVLREKGPGTEAELHALMRFVSVTPDIVRALVEEVRMLREVQQRPAPIVVAPDARIDRAVGLLKSWLSVRMEDVGDAISDTRDFLDEIKKEEG